MSLVGFKAQNHKQQVSQRGARLSVDERGTDPALFEMLNRRFRFTLDVAANAENAKCARFFTKDDDGLVQLWQGDRVWCNPPYSDLDAWVFKAWNEWNARHDHKCQWHVQLIVMLVPANRCEQLWWQKYVEPRRDRPESPLRVEFLPGRPRFTAPGAHRIPPNCRPPFGCALLIWGDA